MIWMEDAEVIRLYNQAKDKSEQIKILCQLNACSTDAIIKILGEHYIPDKHSQRHLTTHTRSTYDASDKSIKMETKFGKVYAAKLKEAAL